MSEPPSGAGLLADLAGERAAVEASLARVAEGALADAPESIAGPILHALRAGGKRLRPILCVAAYRAVRRTASEAVYDLAAAIELVHTYSLIHDDLPSMDDAALRRGQPATHRAFGVPAATLAGAAMIPLAVRVLENAGRALGLERVERAALVRELCRGAGAEGMVGGQVLDLEAEGEVLSLHRLEALHGAKTAALLTASLRIGARAARADETTLGGLTRYGAALGLAFQIADDLLDVTAQPEDTGKTGGDAALEKATYPALLGLDGARERGRLAVSEARRALRELSLDAPLLDALAGYALERDR